MFDGGRSVSPSRGLRTPRASQHRRRVLAGAAAFAAGAMLLAACGGGGSPKVAATTTVPETTTTTTTVPPVTLTASPDTAPSGSSIALNLAGAAPGSSIEFVITKPDGKTFRGSPKVVAPDGTASGTYNTTGDPVGAYTVAATGVAGTVATGTFNLTQALPGQTTKPPATTAKGATTTAPTTTKAATATTTTAKGATTTAKAGTPTTTAKPATTTAKP